MATLVRVTARRGITTSVRSASTLPELLASKNEDLPHRTILHSRHQETRWSVSDLQRHTDALAHGMHELDLSAGDTIVTYMSNEAEHVATIFAAAQQGLNVVSVQDFDGVDEFAAAIQNSKCKAIFFSDFRDGSDGEFFTNLLPDLAEAEEPIILQNLDFPHLQHVLSTRWHSYDNGINNFKNILMYNALTRYQQPAVTEKTALGSAVTGPGKISTPFSHGQLLEAANKITSDLKLDQESKICLQDQSHFGVALAATVALQNTIPLIIPSEYGDEKSFKQAQTDEGNLTVIDTNVVDQLLL